MVSSGGWDSWEGGVLYGHMTAHPRLHPPHSCLLEASGQAWLRLFTFEMDEEVSRHVFMGIYLWINHPFHGGGGRAASWPWSPMPSLLL